MKPAYSEIHQKVIYVERFGSKGKLIKLHFHKFQKTAVSSVRILKASLVRMSEYLTRLIKYYSSEKDEYGFLDLIDIQ